MMVVPGKASGKKRGTGATRSAAAKKKRKRSARARPSVPPALRCFLWHCFLWGHIS